MNRKISILETVRWKIEWSSINIIKSDKTSPRFRSYFFLWNFYSLLIFPEKGVEKCYLWFTSLKCKIFWLSPFLFLSSTCTWKWSKLFRKHQRRDYENFIDFLLWFMSELKPVMFQKLSECLLLTLIYFCSFRCRFEWSQ